LPTPLLPLATKSASVSHLPARTIAQLAQAHLALAHPQLITKATLGRSFQKAHAKQQ